MSGPIDLDDLRKEAGKRVLDSSETEPHYRKCWNCDPVKDYLKEYPHVICCFVCGHIYYKGYDLEIGEDDVETDSSSEEGIITLRRIQGKRTSKAIGDQAKASTDEPQ